VQGRTTFGGLTAALCLEGARRRYGDLPPLRSGQIAFIGPVGGAVRIEAKLLRRGKSSAYVSVDLMTEDGLAARALFAFAARREPAIEAQLLPPPDVPLPEDLPPVPDHPAAPAFVRNFERRPATGGVPLSGPAGCDFSLWIRHRDPAARDLSAFVALADMPPPALFPMFPRFLPISTMTWQLDLFEDAPPAGDGWFLMRTRADSAAAGYSSQDMFIWGRDRRPLAAARQTVAVFL
jgi:acyl-CoA thioesterase